MQHNALFAGDETTPLGIRGLHIDICRHFIQAETILRIIDKMAQLKLNTLHLHLSDDQSFPVEFACAPQVQSDPQLSIADQEAIADACKAHGIEIIPEIDIPGHARAFLSFFEEDVTPEKKLGLITTETIDIDKHLPIIFDMFEELVARFGAKKIHMGGDEARQYERFPELITKVCDWAAARELDVIAWDDVLTAIDFFPENLIIQRWRFRTSPKIRKVRTILSWGYYLDHVDDPFTYYNRSPQMWGENLGCIACMWTELVDDHTIERTVFPAMYMIAHRWWHFPTKEVHLPPLLRALCDAFGYPESEHDSWETRRWVGFYKDDPRSTSSVTVDDPLNRDQDLYPVYSRSLVIATDALYRWFQFDEFPNAEEQDTILALGQKAYGEDLTYLFAKERGWRKRTSKLIKQKLASLLHKNGLKTALKRALQKPAA